jgi:hypothetical protein
MVEFYFRRRRTCPHLPLGRLSETAELHSMSKLKVESLLWRPVHSNYAFLIGKTRAFW